MPAVPILLINYKGRNDKGVVCENVRGKYVKQRGSQGAKGSS